MICPNCSTEMFKTTGQYQYRECGLDYVFLNNVSMFFCDECAVTFPLLPNPEELVKLIAEHLIIQASRLDGDAVLFLRKAIGLRGQDLATILKVDRVTVSRWENKNTQIDGLCDFKLRLAAIDRVCLPSEQRKLRESVVNVIQHEYPSDVGIQKLEISLPCRRIKEVSEHDLNAVIVATTS